VYNVLVLNGTKNRLKSVFTNLTIRFVNNGPKLIHKIGSSGRSFLPSWTTTPTGRQVAAHFFNLSIRFASWNFVQFIAIWIYFRFIAIWIYFRFIAIWIYFRFIAIWIYFRFFASWFFSILCKLNFYSILFCKLNFYSILFCKLIFCFKFANWIFIQFVLQADFFIQFYKLNFYSIFVASWVYILLKLDIWHFLMRKRQFHGFTRRVSNSLITVPVLIKIKKIYSIATVQAKGYFTYFLKWR
jgi:hypothetical protein